MEDLLAIPSDDARSRRVVDAIARSNRQLPRSIRTDKYSKMVSSVLVFYRGTNHLFWDDFAQDWRLSRFGDRRTRTWLQGDLHVYNFGSYDNSRGEIVYDLNDFDEGVIADYQFDVWRMAASLVLIARQNGELSDVEQASVVRDFADGYLNTLAAFRATNRRGQVHFTSDNTYGKLDDFLAEVRGTYSREGMLDKWAPKTKRGRRRRFDLSREKLGHVKASKRRRIEDALKQYVDRLEGKLAGKTEYFKVEDVARRLQAGTGSLGTSRYYVLIRGCKGKDKDRILDVKQQRKPVAFNYLKDGQRSVEHAPPYRHAAQWHVEAYQALTRRTDRHLGWLRLSGDYYSVRERSPWKEAFPCEALRTVGSFRRMARQWGPVLAANHARSGVKIKISLPDEVGRITDGCQRQFCDQVRSIACDYAGQVESDWRSFKASLKISDKKLERWRFEAPTYRRGNLVPE